MHFFSKFKFDSILFYLILANLIFGFIMFFSASLGVMARYEAKFYRILNNQFFYGIILGLIAYSVGLFFNYKLWRKLAYIIYSIAVLLCLLVFVDYFGFTHGGARRWIEIAGFSLQPSEILKYANIILLSAIYTKFANKLENWKYRLIPLLIVLSIIGLVAIQPDFGTTAILVAGVGAIFLGTIGKLKDILFFISLIVVGMILFISNFSHAKERIHTFINNEKDTLGNDYQIRQNVISIGSGKFFGNGFGQGIQKYHHLPEPVGDSIFASIGEEFGFVGSLIILFLILSINLRILYKSFFIRENFAKSILIGVSITLLSQSFLNLGSATGAIPLTGVPLPLISHGSTSLIFTLAMLGVCTQIVGKRELYKVEV